MKNNLVRVLVVLGMAVAVALVPANATPCSLANTAGNWDYTYTGTIFTPSGALPAASVGHFRSDTSGNFTGSQVRTVAGDSGVEDTSGTFSVNGDCTGTATVSVFVNGQLQRTAVLAGTYDNNRKHARYIFQSLTLPDGTNVPVVLTIDASRQFPQ